MQTRFISTALVFCALFTASCQGNRVDAANPSNINRANHIEKTSPTETSPLAAATTSPEATTPNPVATPSPLAQPTAALETAAAKTTASEAIAREIETGIPSTAVASTAVAVTEQPGPKFGILTNIQAGDYRCYASITGQDGKQYNLGATFEVCTSQYLHDVVQFTYERIPSLTCRDVNFAEDCPEVSAQDATATEIVITQIEPIDSSQIVSTSYSNRDWNITVSSFEPWSGINNTGNATYKGCDSEGNCIELSGGTSTCRDGECWTTWHNGNARYSIIETLGEEPSQTARLLVLIDGQVGVDDSTLQIDSYPNP